MTVAEKGFISKDQWVEFAELYPEASSWLELKSMETELAQRLRHASTARLAGWQQDRIRELQRAILAKKGETT